MFPTVCCPICSTTQPGPFPRAGCSCGFSLSGLAGYGTSQFQLKKDPQHRDILFGRDIQLNKKPFNTSFDYYGAANLVDIVDYALTYGDKRTIQSLHGGHNTEVIVSYIPDIIGSGLSKFHNSTVSACSGVCLMSPESINGYDHSFAVLDRWVTTKFAGESSCCRFCSKSTPFGIGVCTECFSKNGNRWQNFIDPTYSLVL